MLITIYLPEIGAPYYPFKHAARSHFIPVAFRSGEAADWATTSLRNHQHTLRDGSLDNSSLTLANGTYRLAHAEKRARTIKVPTLSVLVLALTVLSR